MFNPLMLTVAKTAWLIGETLSVKGMVGKIFEGEMLIRTFQTTLLQIFFKTILNSQDNVKSIKDPGETLKH